MNNNNGALSFDALIEDGSFKKSINQMENSVRGLSNTTVKETSKMDQGFQRLSYAIAGYFSIDAMIGFATQMTRVRGEFQQLEIAFTTMLKSKSAADNLLKEAVDLAARTPFGLMEVANATKQLLAYGVEAKNVTKTIEMLGNVASGVGSSVGDIAYLYGTLKTQGRAFQQDINQFTGRGIPIIKELASQFKVAESEVRNLVETGQVGFPQIEKAFQNMTSESGMFFNLMAEQSKSLTGQLANLGDTWDVMLNEMGKDQEGLFSDAIGAATSLVENYEKVIEVVQLAAIAFGAYKAATMITSIAMQSQALGSLSAALIRATGLQAAFNLVSKANPLGLAMAAITAAIGGYALYQKSVAGATDATVEMQTEMNKAVVSANSLFAQLKSTKEGTQQYADTIKIVNDRYGSYLNNLLTNKSTLNDIEAAQKRVTSALLADIATRSSSAKIEEAYGKYAEKNEKTLNKYADAFAKAYGSDRLPEFFAAMQTAVDATSTSTQNFGKVANEVYAKYIKPLGGIKYDYFSFKDDIRDVGELKAETDGLVNKLQSFASGFKMPVLKIDEPEETTSVSESVKKEKEIKKKSFDEELQYKKSQYELYYKWINHLGKEAADREFKELLQNGKSYTEFLTNEINKVKPKVLSGTASESESNMFSSLSVQYDDITGVKSAMDVFRDSISNAKNEATTLIEYLEEIKSLQSNIADDESDLGFEKKRLLAEEELEAQKEIRNQDRKRYDEAFNEALSFEQRIMKIKQDYADKVKALGVNITGVQKAQLEENLQSELDAAFRKTNIYTQLGEEAIVITRDQLKKQINVIEQLLSDGSITGVIKDQLESELSNLKFNLNLGAKNFNIKNLEAELDTVQKAIDKYLEINDIGAFDTLSRSAINANPELKTLIERLLEVQGIIEEVKESADDGGKGLSGFLARLSGNEGLEKFAIWGDMAAQSFSEMSNALGGVDTKAGYALDTMGELVGVAANLGKALLSNNPVQIVGAIAKGISSIFSISKKTKEMNAAARQSIADFYAEALKGEREYQDLLNQRAIESVKNNSVRLQAIKDEIALRKKQADADRREFDETLRKVQSQSYIKDQEYKHGTWFRKAKTTNIMGSLRGKSFDELNSLLLQGKLQGETKALVERLVELEKQGYDASLAMGALAKETAEIFTGTTASNLTDSLANMFKEGKTGVEDLADFFESTMQDAAMSIFKNKVLSDMMSKFYDRFVDATLSDDDLTENEIASLQQLFNSNMADALKRYEDMVRVIDPGQVQPEEVVKSLEGSVKGITEETASILAGTFNAIRINQIEALSIIREHLLHLQEIASNTRYNKYLESIDKKLDKLESDPLRAKGLI